MEDLRSQEQVQLPQVNQSGHVSRMYQDETVNVPSQRESRTSRGTQVETIKVKTNEKTQVEIKRV